MESNKAITPSENEVKTLFNLDRLWTLIAYLLPVAILCSFRYLLKVTTCDDAFITFKIGLNLAKYGEMSFNNGEPLYITTTPLWALILGAGRFIIGDVIAASKILGTIFEILFLISLVHLGYLVSKSRVIGVLTAVLMCTNPVYLFTSFSGMEISLFLFILTLSLIFYAREKYNWSLVFGACAIWVRFDGIIMFALLLVLTLIKFKSTKFVCQK